MGEEIKIVPDVSLLLLAVLGERLGAACRRTLSRGPSTSRPKFLKRKIPRGAPVGMTDAKEKKVKQQRRAAISRPAYSLAITGSRPSLPALRPPSPRQPCRRRDGWCARRVWQSVRRGSPCRWLRP